MLWELWEGKPHRMHAVDGKGQGQGKPLCQFFLLLLGFRWSSRSPGVGWSKGHCWFAWTAW